MGIDQSPVFTHYWHTDPATATNKCTITTMIQSQASDQAFLEPWTCPSIYQCGSWREIIAKSKSCNVGFTAEGFSWESLSGVTETNHIQVYQTHTRGWFHPVQDQAADQPQPTKHQTLVHSWTRHECWNKLQGEIVLEAVQAPNFYKVMHGFGRQQIQQGMSPITSHSAVQFG